jgi:hypothetical protein
MRIEKNSSEARPQVTRVGQRFYDEAVMVEVSKAHPLSLAINHFYASKSRTAARMPRVIEDISHYERVELRWMKPDGKGGVVPRNN